jgi:PAS domain S-box-containing protein
MSDVATNRRSPVPAIVLAAVGIAGVGVSFAVASAPTPTQATVSALTSAGAALGAAVVLRLEARRRRWPGAGGFAGAMTLVGIASVVFAIVGAAGEPVYGPSPSDALFLSILVPLALAAQQEFRAHFNDRDRRDVAIDVWLISASIAAILYVAIRPADADGVTSVSAATFAVLAATLLTTFAALTLWVPTMAHLLQFLAFSGYAIATLQFGWDWTRGAYAGGAVWVNAAYVVCPVALALIVTYVSHDGEGARPAAPLRVARPALTSASVFTACAALAVISILDDARNISPTQSTLLIAMLGAGVAARILANQIAGTQAHQEVRTALARREVALRETDAALERVREANETLRQSEEHLRLVFDAAVDGFVELDHHDVILRANDSFTRMVGMDRDVIEGQPWAVLAAAIDGADVSFAGLPDTGQARIERIEGQPLYLESRISQVPTTPPRRLLLVRDVTAAKVADQTIRSLFQFLQDRDEDRTRLLRRTNVAIEAERNRIARDLHDGPVQGVSAASLSLEAALLMIKAGDSERGIEVLQKIRQELAGEADALRRLMSGLRPPVLEERGLIPALRDTLVRFGTEQGIATQFNGTLAVGVPTDLETLAYRVVQEALTNCSKHAGATRVSVHVESDQNQLQVEVEDDGQGFDGTQAREFLRLGRVGLASMRERVELASGTFTVRSSPGRGTTITAVLPLDMSLAAAGVT